MADYISTGTDWFLVTSTERTSVEAGTTTKATIASGNSRKKKD